MSSWTHWGIACSFLPLTIVTPWAWVAVGANVITAVACTIFSTRQE